MPPTAVSQETYLQQNRRHVFAGNGCVALAADPAVIALVPGGSEGVFVCCYAAPGSPSSSPFARGHSIGCSWRVDVGK